MVSTGAIALLRHDILLLAVRFFRCSGFFVSTLRFVLSDEPRVQAESECGYYLCGFVATAFSRSHAAESACVFLRRFLHINLVGQTPAKLRSLKKSHFRLHPLWNLVENDAKTVKKWSPVPLIVQPEECWLNVRCAFGAAHVIDFNLLNCPFYDFSLLMHHLNKVIYFRLFVLWISRQFRCVHRYHIDWFKNQFRSITKPSRV